MARGGTALEPRWNRDYETSEEARAVDRRVVTMAMGRLLCGAGDRRSKGKCPTRAGFVKPPEAE